jgi:hypothetical protein
MEICKAFKKSLEKPKHRDKKEVIKNKNVFNYSKNDKVSNKEKNKVITTIKKKCGCGCGDIKTFKPKNKY